MSFSGEVAHEDDTSLGEYLTCRSWVIDGEPNQAPQQCSFTEDRKGGLACEAIVGTDEVGIVETKDEVDICLRLKNATGKHVEVFYDRWSS